MDMHYILLQSMFMDGHVLIISEAIPLQGIIPEAILLQGIIPEAILLCGMFVDIHTGISAMPMVPHLKSFLS